MRDFFRNNGLTIVLLALFAFSLGGQFFAGWMEYNDEQLAHRQQAVDAVEYLGAGHFWEALFENWESEFLQMACYVVFTVFLFQKGASESKEPGTTERVDVVPGKKHLGSDVPWPVKHGGFVLTMYQNSLSIVLTVLFLLSFVLHAWAGAKDYNEEQEVHGLPQITTMEYMGSSRFWFESFQNWQSEFFSIAVLVVLSIFLRQKGSPESKPVDAAYSDTGTE